MISGGSSRIFMGGCRASEASPVGAPRSASEVRVSAPSELRQGSGKFLGYYTFKSAFLQ